MEVSEKCPASRIYSVDFTPFRNNAILFIFMSVFMGEIETEKDRQTDIHLETHLDSSYSLGSWVAEPDHRPVHCLKYPSAHQGLAVC